MTKNEIQILINGTVQDNNTGDITPTELRAILSAIVGSYIHNNDPLPNLPNFSTTEVDTGQKWIDDRPIYQKVVVWDMTYTSGVSYAELSTTPNLDYIEIKTFIKQPILSGVAYVNWWEAKYFMDTIKSVSANAILSIWSDYDSDTIGINVTDQTTRITVNVDVSGYEGYSLLRYVKNV